MGMGATSTRSSLLAETLPINQGARQSLISQGQALNIVGIVGIVLGAVGLTTCLIFLPQSF